MGMCAGGAMDLGFYGPVFYVLILFNFFGIFAPIACINLHSLSRPDPHTPRPESHGAG